MAEETRILTRPELVRVLQDITFRNTVLDFKWNYLVVREVYGELNANPIGWFLQVAFERPDTETGKVGIGRGRLEFVPIGTTISGVVKTCYLLVELVVRHELMEGFRWQDCRIFNPHHRVDELSTLECLHQET